MSRKWHCHCAISLLVPCDEEGAGDVGMLEVRKDLSLGFEAGRGVRWGDLDSHLRRMHFSMAPSGYRTARR